MLAGALGAGGAELDSLTVSDRTYRKLVIIGANVTDLYFKHEGGLANVKLKYLDAELQKRFGYDPIVAAATEEQQLKEDKTFRESVGQTLAAQAEQKVKEVREAAASSEESLADAVSAQSLLGHPAPKLDGVKWVGDAPAADGKALLVFFWTTWSVPCRKTIPELNGYHRKFGDRLAVVALSGQSEKDLGEYGGPKIEFPVGVDAESKFAGAAGVTSVPSVLLADTNGVVRYFGHPAALDSAKLQKLALGQ